MLTTDMIKETGLKACVKCGNTVYNTVARALKANPTFDTGFECGVCSGCRTTKVNTEHWMYYPVEWLDEPRLDDDGTGAIQFEVSDGGCDPFTLTDDTYHQEWVTRRIDNQDWDKEAARAVITKRYLVKVPPPPPPPPPMDMSWVAEAVNLRNTRIGLLQTLVAIGGTKPAANDGAPTVAAPEARKGDTRTMTQMIANPVVDARLVAVGGPGQHSIASFAVPGQSAPQAVRVQLPHDKYSVGDTVRLELQVDPRYKVVKAGAAEEVGEVTGFHTAVASASEVHPGAVSGAATVTSTGLTNGLRKVRVPANFYVTEELKKYFNALQRLSAHGKPVRGRLIGPTGVGKTTGVYYFAALTDRPFLKVNMSTISAPEELFGIRTLENGKTGFQETAFVRALQTPNACIFLEEINRTHSSNVNPLMEVLDGFGETWIDAVQQLITVDPSVTIFAAMNVGAAYTGTFDMDAALESRFEYPIELSYLPAVEEAKVLVLKTGVDPLIATGMVELAGDTRRMAQSEGADALDKAISTRTLLAACDLIAVGGMTPSEALQATVLPMYSIEGGDGSQRAKVAKITQGKFSRTRR